jgi:hypothetical protein
MHDPWFPIILMLIVLVTIWLGIVGPMPNGVAAWLHEWQTLTAAIVAFSAASIASYIAVQNTSRSLQQAERLEKHRRMRKHSAVRSVLPIALAELSGYAEQSVHALNELVSKCNVETLPPMIASPGLVEELPSKALTTLADFIEYSDTVDVAAIEGITALIQIHNSRLGTLYRDNRDPSGNRPVTRTDLERSIVDAASIYAGVVAVFDYARRREEQLPRSLTWDAVTRALNNMRLFQDEHPRLHEAVTGRENVSAGPFDLLRAKPI